MQNQDLSLAECFKGDPFQHVYRKKAKMRESNVAKVKSLIGNSSQNSHRGSMSHRENEKQKLIEKAESAFDKSDFVSILTSDPIHEAFKKKQQQSGQS